MHEYCLERGSWKDWAGGCSWCLRTESNSCMQAWNGSLGSFCGRGPGVEIALQRAHLLSVVLLSTLEAAIGRRQVEDCSIGVLGDLQSFLQCAQRPSASGSEWDPLVKAMSHMCMAQQVQIGTPNKRQPGRCSCQQHQEMYCQESRLLCWVGYSQIIPAAMRSGAASIHASNGMRTQRKLEAQSGAGLTIS